MQTRLSVLPLSLSRATAVSAPPTAPGYHVYLTV